jgi:hypothetical protein
LIPITEGAQQKECKVYSIRTRARLGEIEVAIAEADAIRKETIPDSVLYDLACAYALAAESLADQGEPDSKNRAEHYARIAVDLLQHSAQAKQLAAPSKIAEVVSERDLHVLRERSDFERFLKQLQPAGDFKKRVLNQEAQLFGSG